MRVIGDLVTLVLGSFLLLLLPSLMVAFWGLAFLTGFLSTVFSFKSMR